MSKKTHPKKNTGRFPFGLLNASSEEKKLYFNKCIISHKRLDEAIDKTMCYLGSNVPERLILVCGPSGVGKKELINGVAQRIINAEEKNQNKTDSTIPVVEVEAIAPEAGSFGFKGLWLSALEKMKEPMLDRKISYTEVEGYDSNGNKVIMSKVIKADYQKILQNTLYHRRVKALIINEAHHMLRVSTGKKANWSVDMMKSLANGSKTPIVLVGTYSLLDFLDGLSPDITDQINLRTKIVNFSRYHEDDKSEVLFFGKTAKKLLFNMPFESIDDKFVNKHWQYLYKYSLGRVGALKVWLMDAYNYAIEQGAQSLSMEHLDATRISGRQCEIELRGIWEGEKKMANILSEGSIDDALNFIDRSNNAESITKKAKAQTRSKPFNRNPTRDAANKGLENMDSDEVVS